jgi:hypothetical protein
MKKKKRARRKHRRNPSHHPILVGIAVVFLEGIANWVLRASVGKIFQPANPSYPLATAGGLALTAGGGYAIGRHFFPNDKTPILVGSILHAIFHGITAVSRRSQALGVDASAPVAQVTQ